MPVIRPPRMTITRMDTGALVSAQFNPEQVEEELSVNYAELSVLGLSHKPMQYLGTSNLALNYDLGFDVLSIDGGSALAARKFLHSVCYASKAAQGIASGDPPDLLFFWPGLYSIVCRLLKLKISFKRFNSSLTPTLFVATVNLAEIRQFRLYSEDVDANGTIRS